MQIYAWIFIHCSNHHSDNHASHIAMLNIQHCWCLCTVYLWILRQWRVNLTNQCHTEGSMKFGTHEQSCKWNRTWIHRKLNFSLCNWETLLQIWFLLIVTLCRHLATEILIDVGIIECYRLLGTNPLPQPMLTYCQIYPCNQTSVEF